jgi:hypothetical protein
MCLQPRNPTLIATLLLSLAGTAPALANATTSAEFTVATCRDAVDDLAKVDAIAREKNWTAAPEAAARAQNNSANVKSAWMVEEGDDNFAVATATNDSGGLAQNICMVMFPGVRIPRDPFFHVMSAAMELKLQAQMTFPQGHVEIFEIKSRGVEKKILQLVVLNDGNIAMANVASMKGSAVSQPTAPEQVDGSVRAFRALDAHTVYVLGTDGNLWREFEVWNNALEPRERVDGNVRAFQALDATIAYVLGSDGKLWREFGAWDNAQQPRHNVDANVRAFQAVDASLVYVLGSDGKLWREFGVWNNAQQPRQNVDANVRAFQALDATIVYVLGNDGRLWREFSRASNREQPPIQVDGDVAAFHALDSSVVYVLGTDGNLWREFDISTAVEQPRVWVDGSVKSFQALDAQTVFVLGTDGKLWRERGTLQSRVQVAANVLTFQPINENTVYALCRGDVLFRIVLPNDAPVAETSRDSSGEK